MYSPEIVARRMRSVESAYNVRFHRYSIDDSRAISRDLTNSAYDEKGQQVRALSRDEQDFIWNEMTISRNDFRYWAERHVQIVTDSDEGTKTHITMTGAQEVFLSRMAKTEERMWQEKDAGNTRFDGQCYFVHKARQMGLSTHCELIGVHLTNFFADVAGLCGSTDDQKTQDMYRNYFLTPYDNMPPWMRGPLKSKVKDRGLLFASGSWISLQDSSQKAGFGQGAKWHWSHCTEVASWANTVEMMENHYFPSISRSIRGHAFAESTSQGMHDWWHTRTELARKGKFDRWQYLFIPWYLVPEFYHDYPADAWIPKKETAAEAELIERTSWEWADGRTIRLSREQMYWWEKTRQGFVDRHTLNEFYKSYPSVPEQSFVHSGQSSFEVEVLEACQQQTRTPVAYEIATASTPTELVISSDKELREIGAKIYSVGKYDLVPMRVPEDEQYDSRGLVLLWEKPHDQFDYFLGADPAVGIANWSRYVRTKKDGSRDNSALEIIRRGFNGQADVQVAEFAAPIFPQDFALYVNVLGRMFKGRAEEGMALATVEVNNHGILCQNELMHRYDYINLYQRRKTSDGVNVDYAETFGWLTTASTIREIWTLGKKHISDARLFTRSNWLVTEMRNCVDDNIRTKMVLSLTRGKAEGGDRHDDRVYAMLFALEGAHSWTHGLLMPPSHQIAPVTVEGSPRKYSFAERDMTSAQVEDYIAEWEAGLGEL